MGKWLIGYFTATKGMWLMLYSVFAAIGAVLLVFAVIEYAPARLAEVWLFNTGLVTGLFRDGYATATGPSGYVLRDAFPWVMLFGEAFLALMLPRFLLFPR